MKKIILLVFLFVAIGHLSVKACTCMSIPCTFLAGDIEDDQTVVHARIIGHDRIDKKYDVYERDLTKLVVLHQYTTAIIPDTIYFFHGQSAACDRSLSSNNIGDEFILKLHEKSFFNVTMERPIYGMSICNYAELPIIDGKIKGYVSKNRKCSRREKKINKIRQRHGDYASIGYDRLPKGQSREQKMTVKRFNKVWKRKMNT